jgi:hypothetical protein
MQWTIFSLEYMMKCCMLAKVSLYKVCDWFQHDHWEDSFWMSWAAHLHQHLWTCISSLLMQIHSICCMSDRCPMDWYCNSNFYGNAASKHCWCSGLCTKVEPCSLNHILERKKKFMLVPRCSRHRKWEVEEDCDLLLICLRPWSLQWSKWQVQP